MSAFPIVYLVRHGETAWSASRRATGLSDIPLTPTGEADARNLANTLRKHEFVRALSSPSARAVKTAQLSGFNGGVQIDPQLHEWDYGLYEGMTTLQIQNRRPGWNLYADGCPNGETVSQVGARADEVIAKLRSFSGNVIVFAHRDILRIIAARWVGFQPVDGQRFQLDPCSIVILGYGHDMDEPMIVQLNMQLPR